MAISVYARAAIPTRRPKDNASRSRVAPKNSKELKRKLEAEGLFDPARNANRRSASDESRDYSPTGAALRDFLRTLENDGTLRNPDPTHSRPGLGAAGGSRRLKKSARLRFGHRDPRRRLLRTSGRSTRDCRSRHRRLSVPVVSAVGHEVDFTIADFVADIRVAT
jgi:exodeoxyribonuclease VII large subunit